VTDDRSSGDDDSPGQPGAPEPPAAPVPPVPVAEQAPKGGEGGKDANDVQNGAPQADIAASEVGTDVAQAAALGRQKRPARSEWAMEREGRQNELHARRDELELKKAVAPWLFVALGTQLGLANAIFLLYCIVNGFKIDPGVMQVWLSAAVVQVLGLVWIVVRYLFSATAAPDGPGRRFDRS
jgi:hypothetical protein